MAGKWQAYGLWLAGDRLDSTANFHEFFNKDGLVEDALITYPRKEEIEMSKMAYFLSPFDSGNIMCKREGTCKKGHFF